MKKILVLDDEVDILTLVEIILTRNNFKVETISRWQDIHQSIKSFNPDAILMDVSLGGGADGREICYKLKTEKDTAHIPVIIFSANFDIENNLRDCKADAIIVKPFTSAEIINKIAGVLN